MNSDMVLDALRSLELRWQDLTFTLEQLALAINQEEPVPTRVIVPASGTTPAVEALIPDLVGLGTNAQPPNPPLPGVSLRDQAETEQDAVHAATDLLTPDLPTVNFLTNTVPPLTAAGPPGAIQIFGVSKQALKNLSTSADPTPGFQTLFPTEVNDTLQHASCRDRIRDLRDFIDRSLRTFNELLDKTGFTQQFDTRALRDSVENLAAYPLLTSDVDGFTSPRPSPSSGNGHVSIKRTVSVALREVLGGSPRAADTRSFVAALDHSFTASEEAGLTTYKWTPRAYAGQTELGGGVTGAQASIYGRAKVTLDNALPLLDSLYSLREDEDQELVTASRGIARTELCEIVAELGTEGGPRVARVDNLFDLLLTKKFAVPGGKPPVDGHLGMLAHDLGLDKEHVNTLDEESNLTDFTALHDYVLSLRDGWLGFRRQLGSDMGTQFVQLSRALTVTAESVDEVNEAMDSVFVSAGERQVASFEGVGGRRLTVADLLSWIASFATDEAPTLIHEGGRRGADSLSPTVQLLGSSIDLLLRAIATDRELSNGMRQPRVINTLRELRGHLLRIDRIASELRGN